MKQILCFGDSNTYGYIPENGKRYAYADRWTGILSERLKDEDCRVILMLGTNDCKTVYGASAEVIGKGIEKLIRQIKSADPATKILLVSPIWLGEGVWEEGFDQEFNQNSVETSKKLKKVYEKIASDYGCDFLAASDYVKPSEADREHLSLESHRILSDVIYEKLKEERKSA